VKYVYEKCKRKYETIRVDERSTTKMHHKCEERTGRSKIQGVHDGVQPAVSWYQETGTHVRTSSECMRRKRDQDFYAERGAHEGASKGDIAYTTDNEREVAWRRKKKKESDFCLMKREKKKINFQNSIQKDRQYKYQVKNRDGLTVPSLDKTIAMERSLMRETR
jgi:hypothetical protein